MAVDILDLKKQVLFEGIDDVHLMKLIPKLKVIDFEQGSYLFREKEDTEGIYLIRKGRLEITKTTPDGWKQTIAILGAGHFCGELSILEKRSHEANAHALEDGQVFLLTKEEFERIEDEDNVLATIILKKLAYVLSKNLRRMNDKFLNALINY